MGTDLGGHEAPIPAAGGAPWLPARAFPIAPRPGLPRCGGSKHGEVPALRGCSRLAPAFWEKGRQRAPPAFLHTNTRGTQEEPQVEWKRGCWGMCSQWLGFPSPSILHNGANAPAVMGWGHQAK